jgi:hypothetical protein
MENIIEWNTRGVNMWGSKFFFITNTFCKFEDVGQQQDDTTNWKSGFSNSNLSITNGNDEQCCYSFLDLTC